MPMMHNITTKNFKGSLTDMTYSSLVNIKGSKITNLIGKSPNQFANATVYLNGVQLSGGTGSNPNGVVDYDEIYIDSGTADNFVVGENAPTSGYFTDLHAQSVTLLENQIIYETMVLPNLTAGIPIDSNVSTYDQANSWINLTNDANPGGFYWNGKNAGNIWNLSFSATFASDSPTTGEDLNNNVIQIGINSTNFPPNTFIADVLITIFLTESKIDIASNGGDTYSVPVSPSIVPNQSNQYLFTFLKNTSGPGGYLGVTVDGTQLKYLALSNWTLSSNTVHFVYGNQQTTSLYPIKRMHKIILLNEEGGLEINGRQVNFVSNRMANTLTDASVVLTGGMSVGDNLIVNGTVQSLEGGFNGVIGKDDPQTGNFTKISAANIETNQEYYIYEPMNLTTLNEGVLSGNAQYSYSSTAGQSYVALTSNYTDVLGSATWTLPEMTDNWTLNWGFLFDGQTVTIGDVSAEVLPQYVDNVAGNVFSITLSSLSGPVFTCFFSLSDNTVTLTSGSLSSGAISFTPQIIPTIWYSFSLVYNNGIVNLLYNNVSLTNINFLTLGGTTSYFEMSGQTTVVFSSTNPSNARFYEKKVNSLYLINNDNDGNITAKGIVKVENETDTANLETGALVVVGGAAVGKTLYASNIVASEENPYSIIDEPCNTDTLTGTLIGDASYSKSNGCVALAKTPFLGNNTGIHYYSRGGIQWKVTKSLNWSFHFQTNFNDPNYGVNSLLMIGMNRAGNLDFSSLPLSNSSYDYQFRYAIPYIGPLLLFYYQGVSNITMNFYNEMSLSNSDLPAYFDSSGLTSLGFEATIKCSNGTITGTFFDGTNTINHSFSYPDMYNNNDDDIFFFVGQQIFNTTEGEISGNEATIFDISLKNLPGSVVCNELTTQELTTQETSGPINRLMNSNLVFYERCNSTNPLFGTINDPNTKLTDDLNNSLGYLSFSKNNNKTVQISWYNPFNSVGNSWIFQSQLYYTLASSNLSSIQNSDLFFFNIYVNTHSLPNDLEFIDGIKLWFSFFKSNTSGFTYNLTYQDDQNEQTILFTESGTSSSLPASFPQSAWINISIGYFYGEVSLYINSNLKSTSSVTQNSNIDGLVSSYKYYHGLNAQCTLDGSNNPQISDMRIKNISLQRSVPKNIIWQS